MWRGELREIEGAAVSPYRPHPFSVSSFHRHLKLRLVSALAETQITTGLCQLS